MQEYNKIKKESSKGKVQSLEEKRKQGDEVTKLKNQIHQDEMSAS